MIIDTHVHEKKFSSDSFISIPEIVEKAKELGLHGICITDHDNNLIEKEAEALSKELNFPIIVGTEVLTHEGDILVFGLEKIPEEKISAQELIHLVVEAGGVSIAAHPFRNNNRGLGEHLRKVKGLDGIEAFNGSTLPHHNLQAFALAKELGLPCFGASDAHIIKKLGTYATVFEKNIKTTKEFITAVKNKEFHPAEFREDGFKNIDLYYTPSSKNSESV